RLYFENNPTAFSYERPPLEQEWDGVDVPSDASVSVYRINNQSRVRALQSAIGDRLAPPVMDVDKEKYSGQSARTSSRAKSVAAAS
ncbi:MAG: hypothetical protein AVDCRST_MAG93-2133, partial [uncultured Chloroflexia bacterium]